MSSTYLPRQIETGLNSLEKLGKIALEFGASKLFVIIDGFLVGSGLNYIQKIKEILKKDGLEVNFFSDYSGEPTTDHLSAALTELFESKSDCVVAIGGGSAIDISKAVSVFAVNHDLSWEDIQKKDRIERLPLIAVPTTAGTGSEATKIMVIKNVETNIKMNPGHRDLVPDAAILDPLLTKSLPSNFTVYTGLDALAHAMEAFVSTKSSVATDSYALNAIRIIGKALPKVYENGSNLKAREEMLLASCYAGIAFSNSSTNLAHAAGRPLGARFHIPHGLSVALLLPFVVEFGLVPAEKRYAEIAISLGEEDTSDSTMEQAKKAMRYIQEYNEKFSIWKDALKYIDLKDFKENISLLVEDALGGNGIATNPKIPSYDDITNIFEGLYKKLKHTSMIEAV